MFARVVAVAFGVMLAGFASASERTAMINLAGLSDALLEQSTQPQTTWSPYYAAAMLNYRHFARSVNGGQAGGAYPMLPGSTNLNGLAWLWVSSDGSHVQRLDRNLFRLFRRDEASTFYRVVDCYALDWPDFDCSDGQLREMSAPSHALMIFDDTEFERVFLPSIPDLDTQSQ